MYKVVQIYHRLILRYILHMDTCFRLVLSLSPLGTRPASIQMYTKAYEKVIRFKGSASGVSCPTYVQGTEMFTRKSGVTFKSSYSAYMSHEKPKDVCIVFQQPELMFSQNKYRCGRFLVAWWYLCLMLSSLVMLLAWY